MKDNKCITITLTSTILNHRFVAIEANSRSFYIVLRIEDLNLKIFPIISTRLRSTVRTNVYKKGGGGETTLPHRSIKTFSILSKEFYSGLSNLATSCKVI